MSILNEDQLLGAPAGSSQYQIQRSLRFNSADSAYLSRTPASAGNRKTWTWSGWVKRSALSGGSERYIFNAGFSTDDSRFQFNGSDFLSFKLYQSAATVADLTSAAVYRDFSAWYHFVLAVDTTQATSTDRIKIYVNGLQVTISGTYPTQNLDTSFNAAQLHTIAGRALGGAFYFDGYLADIHFIDGQALTPSSFGQTDATTGEWVPIAYTGTYGTNGFKLNFSNNSAATATTLGADSSGNGNNWTPNNLQASSGPGYASWFSPPMPNALAAFDASTTTTPTFPTGTTFTWTVPASVNLTVTSSLDILTQRGSSNGTGVRVYYTDATNEYQSTGSGSSIDITLSFTQLKRISYIEFTETLGGTGRIRAVVLNGTQLIDYGSTGDSLVDTPTSYGTDTGVGGEVRGNYCTLNPLDQFGTNTLSNGNLDVTLGTDGPYNLACGTVAITSGKWYWEVVAPTMTAGTMIGISRSTVPVSSRKYGDSNSRYYSQNGNKWSSASGVAYGASYTANDVVGVALDMDAGSLTYYKNGTSQGVAFTGLTGEWYPTVNNLGSGLTQAFVVNFGQRPFAYTAPSGFKALCDTNLPAPTIVKPSTVMDVKLYTGNSSTQTISGLGFSPDLVWLKQRATGSTSHALYDVIRGGTLALQSDATAAEQNLGSGNSVTFNSDGFTLGADTAGWTNFTGRTYVGWCWDAGSSTVTNTAGTISSQVRANASAGFSIVTYTGTGSSATVGHGLGVAPSFIFGKRRTSTANDWIVYHISTGANVRYGINITSAPATDNGPWGNVLPTSSVFTINSASETNSSSQNYVMYCFAPVAGYSAFGSYTGNGSSDGPFVYCGFRPRYLMVKRTTAATTGEWWIWDSSRIPYNYTAGTLSAQSSLAENAGGDCDFLSNGFKPRNSNTNDNGNADTYIYAAFAEFPLQYARAR